MNATTGLRACRLIVLGLPDSLAGRLFDVDGVLTQTAKIHAAAWKAMFDPYLRSRAAAAARPRHVPGRCSSPRSRTRTGGVFEDALAGAQAGRAGCFGVVIGVDRVDHADALRANGANLVPVTFRGWRSVRKCRSTDRDRLL